MKKILIIALLALLTVNMNCGGSGTSSDSSARTALTLNFGEVRDASSLSTSERGMVSTSSIPPHVVSIRITISAPDMPTIVEVIPTAGLTSVSVTIDVPNGPNRHIICEALNDTGGVLYRGETYVDLDGTPISVSIVMVSADPFPPTFAGLSDITSITQTSMILSWSPATDNVTPQNKIQYLVYMATTSGGQNFMVPSFTTSLGATSFTVTGLSPNTTYYFVVRAMDEVGNTDGNMVEGSGKTLAPPDPTPPTFGGLESATALSSTEIGLQWSAATDNVTPSSNIVYLVYMAITSGGQNFATPSATTAPGATTHTITGLSPNTMYYFVVRARDEAGNTDTNTVERSATTLSDGGTPPTFAGLVSATTLSQTAIELSWDPATDDVTPSSEIIYYIYVAPMSGGQNFTVPTYQTAPGVITYNVTGLSQGLTYYFVVRARDGDNNIDSNTVERSATTDFVDLQPINDGMDTSTIFCDVRNNGTIDAVNVDVWFDYTDGYTDNCDDALVSVPGGSVQFTSVAYAFIPTDYRIIVDPYNLIQESDETNNCISTDPTKCFLPLPSDCSGM
jgi:hypothetical protein